MPEALFDADLIRHYNVNGPRYTSYPTADRFVHGNWTDAYKNAIAGVNTAALSLYLHVPFCSTICFYCACNKINTANMKRADSYVQRLQHEMALQSDLVEGPHTVEQLHFGGGTPTFLSDDQFTGLFESLNGYFRLATGDERDFSVEIDPRNVSADRIDHLARLGINRVSVGVQDFDPAVQIAVNRVQSVEETRTVIDAARSSNIRSVNIDLINGLPKQTLAGFARTLEQVISLQPDRLSLYSYAHLPHRFKTQRQIDPNDLPDAELKLAILGKAVDMLADAGFVYVGMDHFARAGDPLIAARDNGTLHRNFQGYTTHGNCQLIGLGVTSIGKVGRVYVQNARHLHDYYEMIDAGTLAIEKGIEASTEDLTVSHVIQDLMCRSQTSFADFADRFDRDFRTYFAPQWPRITQLARHGLIDIDDGSIRVTPRGQFLLRSICMAFDSYLSLDTARFSRAI